MRANQFEQIIRWRFLTLSAQDACSSVAPKNCALVIGLTYFVSALLGLVLKNLIGRRFLMLVSMLGMASAQIGVGVYFVTMTGRCHNTSVNVGHPEDGEVEDVLQKDDDSTTEDLDWRWLPLPLLMTFTAAYNIGKLSITLISTYYKSSTEIGQSQHFLVLDQLQA